MPAKPLPQWPVPLSLAASLLIHVLLVLLLWNVQAQLRLGSPHGSRSNKQHAFVIELAPPAPPQQKPPPSPKPDAQPEPAKPAARTPPRSQPQTATPTPTPPEPQPEPDDVLGSIHDNWLPVPGVFRCHVRIDYQPGGMIGKVNFGSGCGNAVVTDSISRAIWKTQPLPLGKDLDHAGSLEFDFTP